jgi:hypothetical protein
LPDRKKFNPLAPIDLRWLEQFSVKHRDFMQKFGVQPDRHRRAERFNACLFALAERGLPDESLVAAANRLFDQFFGNELAESGNTQQFGELLEVNAAGGVQQLAFVVADQTGNINAGLIGTSNDSTRASIATVAEILEGFGSHSHPAGYFPSAPQIPEPSADQLNNNRFRIHQMLTNFAEATARGRVRGSLAIALTPRATLFRMVGETTPQGFARLLRRLIGSMREEEPN